MVPCYHFYKCPVLLFGCSKTAVFAWHNYIPGGIISHEKLFKQPANQPKTADGEEEEEDNCVAEIATTITSACIFPPRVIIFISR